MKKLFLLVWMVVLSVSVNAVDINECKTDIYYGNGVWNEYKHTEASRLKLQTYVIESEIIKSDP